MLRNPVVQRMNVFPCMQLIQLSTVVVGAIAVGFIKSWKLTLVSAAAVPVVLGFGLLVGWAVRKQESDSKPPFKNFLGTVANDNARHIIA